MVSEEHRSETPAPNGGSFATGGCDGERLCWRLDNTRMSRFHLTICCDSCEHLYSHRSRARHRHRHIVEIYGMRIYDLLGALRSGHTKVISYVLAGLWELDPRVLEDDKPSPLKIEIGHGPERTVEAPPSYSINSGTGATQCFTVYRLRFSRLLQT